MERSAGAEGEWLLIREVGHAGQTKQGQTKQGQPGGVYTRRKEVAGMKVGSKGKKGKLERW